MPDRTELETLPRIVVIADDPLLAPFADIRLPSIPLMKLRLRYLLPVGALLGALAGIVPSAVAFGPIAMSVVAVSLLACLFLATKSLSNLQLAEQYAREDADSAAMGPATAEDRSVGVAYAQGIAALHGRTDWDRGRLRWDGDRLTFQGYGPCFSLPAGLIERVQIAWTGRKVWVHEPRVLVTWRHPDGEPEYICVNAGTIGGRQGVMASHQFLANWIVDGCRASEAPPEPVDLGTLPFRSSAVAL